LTPLDGFQQLDGLGVAYMGQHDDKMSLLLDLRQEGVQHLARVTDFQVPIQLL